MRVSMVNRVWLATVVALVANAALGAYTVNGLLTSQRVVTHTRTVQAALSELLALIVNAETGQRGYLITDDRIYLEPYERALADVDDQRNELRKLLNDHAEQTARFEDLSGRIDLRLQVLKESVDLVDRGQRAAALDVLKEGRGKRTMDGVRQLIAEIGQVERDHMRVRLSDVSRKFWQTVIMNVIGTGLALLVVCVSHFAVRRELAKRIEAESNAQAANDRLEATVETRTRALTQTTNELLRSNQDLEKFAYVASHDLQEPLRKIQAFGDRLKQKAGDSLDATGRDYVDRMQSSAARMRTLITDLLTFSRVSTQGRAFAEVDLAEIVQGVVSDLETRLDACDGQIDVGPLPRLFADPTQMRQLFQNLLSNALKFRKPDVRPVVSIRATSASDLTSLAVPPPPTTGWRITVTDNGIGFDPVYAERIFELFQRLHGRGEYEGTGIGLAVCRKIVERHGGRIVAHGRPDEGSQFVIDLPDLSQPYGAKVP
jgi:signal transduction histidine kinase